MENAGEPLKSDENGEQPEKKFAPLEEKEERESVSHQQESPSSPACDGPKECVKFVVIHNKNKYDVEFPLDETIAKLKLHLQNLLGVPQSLQKVMYKGLAKDEKLLREIGITGGAKVMVVGSKLDDVLAVSTPNTQPASEEKSQSSSKEPLCKQKNHKKIVDRGVPEDVMPGILNTKEPLPPFPLCGMLNKSGGKVRLTFKLELDQLWIGSKERTEKIPMSTIKSIISEPIDGHEEYHIMGIQMGTTEASRYWFYWVPAQYIDSIKDAVLGPWMMILQKPNTQGSHNTSLKSQWILLCSHSINYQQVMVVYSIRTEHKLKHIYVILDHVYTVILFGEIKLFYTYNSRALLSCT